MALTKAEMAEMAEDAAMGIGRGAGETAEDDQPVQAPAPEQLSFGAAPQPQPVVYAQPAGQPQVMPADAESTFAGWDD